MTNSKALNQLMKNYAVKTCIVHQSEIERLSINKDVHYWNNAIDYVNCWRIHTPKGDWYDATPELVRKAPLGSTLRWWTQEDGGNTVSYRKVAGDVWLDVYARQGVEYDYIGRV